MIDINDMPTMKYTPSVVEGKIDDDETILSETMIEERRLTPKGKRVVDDEEKEHEIVCLLKNEDEKKYVLDDDEYVFCKPAIGEEYITVGKEVLTIDEIMHRFGFK